MTRSYPADNVMDKIVDILAQHRICVVSGETGSGKSTRIPSCLVSMMRKRVVCVQPRNIAARSLASYTGGGCWVRGLKNVGSKSFIYMTNGTYLGSASEKYPHEILVIDEIHERSIQVDLLLCSAKKRLQEDPNFKLVVCSATFGVEKFAKYLGVTLDDCYVSIPGRMFRVDIFYPPPVMKAQKLSCFRSDTYLDILNNIVAGVETGMISAANNILVFAPGADEAEYIVKKMYEKMAEIQSKYSIVYNWKIVTLHGQMEPEEQEEIIKFPKPQIIITTNVAETSLTIPRVTTVFDLGTEKVMTASKSDINASELELQKISKASAKQRAGRAGRVQHGVCYRLYSEEDYESFEEERKPEILKVNLRETVLSLRSQGVNIRDLDLIDKPDDEYIANAERQLKWFNALDDNDCVTDIGRFISRLDVATPYAFTLYLAKRNYGNDMMETLAVLISMISVQSPFYTSKDERQTRSKCKDDDSIYKRMLFFVDKDEPLSEHMLFIQVFRWCQEKNFNPIELKEHGLSVKAMKVVRQQYNEVVRALNLQPHKTKYSWGEIFTCLYSSFSNKFAWGLKYGRHCYNSKREGCTIHSSSYFFRRGCDFLF